MSAKARRVAKRLLDRQEARKGLVESVEAKLAAGHKPTKVLWDVGARRTQLINQLQKAHRPDVARRIRQVTT